MKRIGLGTLAVGILAFAVGSGLWFYQACYTTDPFFGPIQTVCQTPYWSQGVAILFAGFILAVVGVILMGLATELDARVSGAKPARRWGLTCSACGGELQQRELSCPHCGRLIVAEKAAEM